MEQALLGMTRHRILRGTALLEDLGGEMRRRWYENTALFKRSISVYFLPPVNYQYLEIK
jgi:hypothetical protein